MEGEKTPYYLAEDLRNIPVMMKELSVKDDMANASCCLPLQDRCEICYRQGTGEPVHKKYVALQDRRKSFPEQKLMGSSPLYLAEIGLFWSGRRAVTCFQCGQDIHLVNGEDALDKHADVFRNCRHVCKILGHPNRKPRTGTEMMSCPTSPMNKTRRRLFSE